MKKRNVLAVLALSTLFACQNSEQISDNSIQMPTSNEKKLDLKIPTQVIAKVNMQEAKDFYPDYSAKKRNLQHPTSEASQVSLFRPAVTLTKGEQETREVKCGKEYVVAKKLVSEDGEKTFVYYKRMSIPIIILDANNEVYKGNDVKIKMHLNTKGYQNLKTGEITPDEKNKEKGSIRLSNLNLEKNKTTNIIPQKFNKGDIIYTIIHNKIEYQVRMPISVDLTQQKVDGIFVQLPFLNSATTRWWWDDDDDDDETDDPDKDDDWDKKDQIDETRMVDIHAFGWVDYTLNLDGTLSEYLPKVDVERPADYNVMDEIPNYPNEYFFNQPIKEVEVYMYQGIYDPETPPDPDLFSKVREVVTIEK